MSEKEKLSYPPKWCKFCKHFGYFKLHNACYKGNFLKILLYGPKIVCFDDCCNRFRYAKKYQTQQKTR